jgi:hypothetical protein
MKPGELREERALVRAFMHVARKRLTESASDAILDGLLDRLPAKYSQLRWKPVLWLARRKADDVLPGPMLDALEDAMLVELQKLEQAGAP